jgi:ABC-type multidrug transport system fused ATPase/permease subunit
VSRDRDLGESPTDNFATSRSWWTWGVILLLIIVFQCIGIFEKVWIQIWGDAYRDRLAAAIAFLINSDLRSAAAPETSHHLAHDLSASPSYMTSRLIFSSGSADAPSTLSLPSANSQPMFYVAVYATIGIGAALLATVNTIVQYTGSFRASRILFTRLLNTVIRAPMRWSVIRYRHQFWRVYNNVIIPGSILLQPAGFLIVSLAISRLSIPP